MMIVPPLTTELCLAWETVHYQRVKMTGLVRAASLALLSEEWMDT